MHSRNEIYQQAADSMGCSIEDVEGVVDAANRETGGKYEADTLVYPTGQADAPDTSAMSRSDRRKADRKNPKRRRAVRFG